MFFHLPTWLRAVALSFTKRRWHLKRFFLIVGLFFAQMVFLIAINLGRIIDLIFYRKYLRQKIESPIFIIANPRSGTTFLHRLMSLDSNFTYFKLWQTLLPTVSFYRAMAWLGRFDRQVGSPLTRLLTKIENRLFSKWDDIHEIGFSRPEEDEGLFIFTLLTPALLFLFPEMAKNELRHVAYVDEMSTPVRWHLANHYRRCIQAHLYATHGEHKHMLFKTVLITGRLKTCLDAAPDARFIHLVRHPYQAIPSMLSMFYSTWGHLPEIRKDSLEVRQIAEIACDYYLRLHYLQNEIGQERFITIRYDDLIAQPQATVELVYARFGLEITPEYRKKLLAETQQSKAFQSKHTYSLEEYGISKDWLYQRLEAAFTAYGFER